MRAEQAIASLNRQLAKHGQDVTLRRVGQPDKTVHGFVRRLVPQGLANGANEGRSSVVLSPSDFADWPSLPSDRDAVAIGAGVMAEVLEPVDVISIDNVPVRISLVVAS